MTSKKALNNIKYIDLHGRYPYPYYLKDDLEYKESIEILEELVNRDTPKKVEIGTLEYFKFPICPNCKEELNEYYKNKYCKECGQRLDWKEKKWNEWINL